MTFHADQSAPYVFLSYASSDRERALRVADLLEGQGVAVWIDRHNIEGGASWSAQIVRGIRGCGALVVLCSAAAMRSRNVQQEIQLAWECGRPALPLLLEQVEYPEAVAYALAGRQWVEVLGQSEEVWLPRLLRGLGGLDVVATGQAGATEAPPAVEPRLPGGGLSPRAPVAGVASVRSSVRKADSGVGGLAAAAPLVGRDDALATLRAAFASVAAGAGSRVVFLSGEPGVGKTRLAEEVGRYAMEQGGWFLAGHYLRAGTLPYGPWLEALRAGVRHVPPSGWPALVGPYGADLAQLFPELIAQLGPFPPGPVLPTDDQRRRLFEGIACLLAGLARHVPVVVLLDDLQWAPGLTLLNHVVRHLGEARVLFLGTYREQEFKEQRALMRDWSDITRARLGTTLALSPLDQAETRDLLTQYLGAGAADQLADAVHRRTRGNAFFTEEVIRSLVESGAIRSTGAGWEVIDAAELHIPESVKLVVEDRVARLGEAARGVLIQAAVLGQEFGVEVLRRLSGCTEDDLLEVLDRALAARLLVDRTTGSEERYGFADDQMQEVLYEGLTAARRRRLHRQAGAILAEVYEASLEPHLEELARHCAEGGQLEQAAGYAFRAAQWNDLVFNWTRSTVLYRTALALWDQAGGHEADIATGCERLANLLVNVGLEPERVHELLLRALEYHEKAGNRRRVAKLHARISRAYFLVTDLGIVDVARGLDHYEKARVILEVEPVGAALGWVYDGLSAISFVLNQAGEAVEWAQRGLEVAERLNEPILHANAQYHLAIGTLSGDVAAGQAALEECWRSSIEHGSPWAADAGRFVAAFVAINLRDPRAALAWAAREPDFRTLMSSFWLPPLVVEAHARLGDFAAAERVCCEVQNSWAALGQPSHGNFPGALAALAHWRGDWPEAQRQLEAGVAWARRSGWLIAGTAAAHRLGEVYLEQGNPSGAEEILRWALDLHRAGSQVLGQIAVVCTLIELTTRQGRLDEARAYLAEAQEILGRPEDWRGLPAGVALAECQVRAAEGRWVEAEAAFQRAIDISQRYELCWDEAKVYHAWGSALLDAEKTSADLSKRLLARGLFSQALTLWETMGAQPYAERCRRRLAELG